MLRCSTDTVSPETTRSDSPAARPVPSRPVSSLSRWQVLLHNDDRNEMGYVVDVLVRVRARDLPGAVQVMCEAHREGIGLIMETHREHAELIAEQLASAGLTATVQPA